jgi:hypothetical protein
MKNDNAKLKSTSCFAIARTMRERLLSRSLLAWQKYFVFCHRSDDARKITFPPAPRLAK